MRTREVFVFVRRGGEFLVLRRTPENGGYWHGVAGGVEDGESWVEAAARELCEETGLVAEPAPLDHRFVYEPEHVTVECFLVDAPAGWEPALNEEHDDYRWCSAGAAETLLYWPEPRELLRELA